MVAFYMSFKPSKTKNILLIVGIPPLTVIQNFRDFKEREKKASWRFAVIHDQKRLLDSQKESLVFFDEVLKCDFNSPSSITKALLPYEGQIRAVTCRAESQILNFAKIVPHLSYLKVPTSESLEWSVNKLMMRKRFRSYDKSISPNYSIVQDDSKETVDKIVEKIGFPLIIKPTGLAQSLLVTIAYHREELQDALKTIFKKIKKVYKDTEKLGDPSVLVEEYMEGTMYSIDAYVNSLGKIYFCPIVDVKTGRSIGFDDFFGYLQTTPTILNKENEVKAQEVCEKAIHALGLRSCTAHVELMKTESGWKVIELGPRIGGFRDMMYRLSFDIDHTQNDLYIRIPKKPRIKKSVKGYTAAMKIYAHKEGVIKSLKGIKKIQELESFYSFASSIKQVGERVKFAKNGGKSVFNIILFNKDRSRLLADIRRLEKTVHIEVE